MLRREWKLLFATTDNLEAVYIVLSVKVCNTL